jgi:hypothetical protein
MPALYDDEALKFGMVASEMESLAQWQGLVVQPKESALVAGGPTTVSLTPVTALVPPPHAPRPPAPTPLVMWPYPWAPPRFIDLGADDDK